MDKVKSKHNIDTVNYNLHQTRKLWKLLKDIVSKTLHKVKSCSVGLDIDDVLCDDQTKAANIYIFYHYCLISG